MLKYFTEQSLLKLKYALDEHIKHYQKQAKLRAQLLNQYYLTEHPEVSKQQRKKIIRRINNEANSLSSIQEIIQHYPRFILVNTVTHSLTVINSDHKILNLILKHATKNETNRNPQLSNR